MQRREPHKTDLLLQMDIEGAEYANLESWDQSLTKRFRIMVIELHGLGQIADNPEAFIRDKLPAFKILRTTHSSVHAHPNNCCVSKKINEFPYEIPTTLEITLLRNNRLKFWRKNHKKSFESPHAEDIGWNVLYNEPLFLGREWNRGSVSPQSELRKASIRSSWLYQRQHELLIRQMSITKSTLESSDWTGGGSLRPLN